MGGFFSLDSKFMQVMSRVADLIILNVMAVMTVEQEMEANELSDLLDGFLETLDKRSRIMFVRRYWYSDSISDLAERFQISNNNVSVRLSRIRGKLKRYLKKEGVEV